MGIKVGICGVGSFAEQFIPLFKLHPIVDNTILCVEGNHIPRQGNHKSLPLRSGLLNS